ncbi:AAA family ATPase [Paenibacillus sp. N4]|uniref:AAA family ATPase n=1 Tax=Paenibacillus vietnamensis TaxID=2590547 RepID=UPI001CD08B66|nr:AAA family ATPase [Paenibacillus vietnamensis]MCA0754176.1 AAA family ATPase [Paenibacillus vietnamensis]
MIVWINGAFGAGKSQTAYELQRRVPGSFVYDPENAGYFIQKNLPKSVRKDDFQHYPMWREMNYSMLNHLNGSFDGLIIAPMTIADKHYFQEIVGRLREDGVTVHHFALCASPDTIRKRLRKRGERSGCWAERQIERCLEGLADPVFREHVDTDDMTVSGQVEYIASRMNVDLMPDRRGAVKKTVDRVITQVKQIRF